MTIIPAGQLHREIGGAHHLSVLAGQIGDGESVDQGTPAPADTLSVEQALELCRQGVRRITGVGLEIRHAPTIELEVAPEVGMCYTTRTRSDC